MEGISTRSKTASSTIITRPTSNHDGDPELSEINFITARHECGDYISPSEHKDRSDDQFDLPQPMRCDTHMNNTQHGSSQAMVDMRSEMTNMVAALRDFTQDTKGTLQQLARAQQEPTECPSCHLYATSEDDDAQSQPDSDQEIEINHHRNANYIQPNPRTYRHGNSKLPPFTGKESWKTWFNRFTDVAILRQWTPEQKLDELLPRLQGHAGEFVYEQLPRRTRTNCNQLIVELNSRFRVVETTKTFATKFANRKQMDGETVEDFAAELKRLYDKAYSNRNLETRQEDLLRTFLHGLQDEQTRFHVEYIKDPDNIDAAVFEVVNFYEIRRRPSSKDSTGPHQSHRRPTRMVRLPDYDSGEETDSDMDANTDKVNRIPAKANRNKTITHAQTSMSTPPVLSTVERTTTENTTGSSSHSVETDNIGELTRIVKQLCEKVDKLEKQGRPPRYQNSTTGTFQRNQNNSNTPFQRNQSGRAPNNRTPPPHNNSWNKFECFRCGQEGHFSRNCPQLSWVTGQMQVAVQPNPPTGPYDNQVQRATDTVFTLRNTRPTTVNQQSTN